MWGAMQHPGWLLVLVGVVIAVLGLIWLTASQIPWFGRLPGDLIYEGKHTRIYAPMVTCLVLSVVLTLVMWIVQRLR
jgi:hypothetical protein